MSMLEKVKFDQSKSHKHVECVICLKEFDDGEELMKIPNCEHIFHE